MFYYKIPIIKPKEANVLAQGSFLYQRVYASLLSRIQSGEYPAGKKLPCEDALRAEFGVSMITLNKALGLLADAGLVRRVPGRGTYVENGRPQRTQPGGGLIGLVLEHVSTPFGLDMLYHMDRAAERAGYRLLARFSYGDQEKEAREIGFLRAQGAAGILLMPSHGPNYSSAILRLYIEGYPTVLVDKKLRGISLPSVRTDNRAAVAGLVRTLYEEGARRIALVSGPDEEVTSVHERCQGFREQMKALGLETEWFWFPLGRDALSYEQDAPSPAAMAAAREFFRGAKGLNALIAAEYGFVPALVAAAQAEGLRLGRDMRLACIDSDALAPCGEMFPHMKQDEAVIAEKAVALLLTRIGGEGAEDVLVPALYRPGTEQR